VLQCVAVCCSGSVAMGRVFLATRRYKFSVCCSVLQCLWRWAESFWLLGGTNSQCVAVCCSVLQCVAVCCRQSAATGRVPLAARSHKFSVCCSMLQCVCGDGPCLSSDSGVKNLSVLQCVAVWCNVLQCGAVCLWWWAVSLWRL